MSLGISGPPRGATAHRARLRTLRSESAIAARKTGGDLHLSIRSIPEQGPRFRGCRHSCPVPPRSALDGRTASRQRPRGPRQPAIGIPSETSRQAGLRLPWPSVRIEWTSPTADVRTCCWVPDRFTSAAITASAWAFHGAISRRRSGRPAVRAFVVVEGAMEPCNHLTIERDRFGIRCGASASFRPLSSLKSAASARPWLWRRAACGRGFRSRASPASGSMRSEVARARPSSGPKG